MAAAIRCHAHTHQNSEAWHPWHPGTYFSFFSRHLRTLIPMFIHFPAARKGLQFKALHRGAMCKNVGLFAETVAPFGFQLCWHANPVVAPISDHRATLIEPP